MCTGWIAGKGGVRAAVVVPTQPVVQRAGAAAAGGVTPGVGPVAQQVWMKRPTLPSALRRQHDVGAVAVADVAVLRVVEVH